jgi:Bacteriocin class II with double-glycine leader peptide
MRTLEDNEIIEVSGGGTLAEDISDGFAAGAISGLIVFGPVGAGWGGLAGAIGGGGYHLLRVMLQ